jgi:hypothetical protein
METTVETGPCDGPRASVNSPSAAELRAALFAALSRAQAGVKAASKSGRNKHGGYDYADHTDLLIAAKKALGDNGLAMIPGDIVSVETFEMGKTAKGAPRRLVRIRQHFYVVHDLGGMHRFEAIGEGEDSGDKAVYKVKTGMNKYALRDLLGIPMRDDPERDTPEPKVAIDEAFSDGIRKGIDEAIEAIASEPAEHWDPVSFAATLEEIGAASVNEVSAYLFANGKPMPWQLPPKHLGDLFVFLGSENGRASLARFRASIKTEKP